MFIDMHMHESTFSKDSFLKLDEMVACKGAGTWSNLHYRSR